MTKDELRFIRHSRVIKDPFPEHSQFQNLLSTRSYFEKVFGIRPGFAEPEAVSIWEAYRMGYEKAYSEIEAALPKESNNHSAP